MTVSRPLAWGLILFTLLGSSLIRQLHEFIPDWTPLPWPVRSPLYAFLVILFLVLVASPASRGAAARQPRGQVALASLAPLLVALVYEKVLSITLYEALLDHAVGLRLVRMHLSSWIHALIGVGMCTAVLLLLPLMRGVRFADFFSALRMKSAVYLQFLALAVTYGLLATLVIAVMGWNPRPTLLFPVGGAALALAAGQCVRAMAEEFYYRGLLQRELASLTASLGLTNPRSGQAVAIALIALGFGVEHFQFGAPLAESYQGFAYAVAAGFLFGYLLVLTGNVIFCGLVHATNNLLTSGIMPRLGTPDGTVVVPSEPVLYLYLIAVFLLVFVATGIRRRDLRRVFLPDSDPAPQE